MWPNSVGFYKRNDEMTKNDKVVYRALGLGIESVCVMTAESAVPNELGSSIQDLKKLRVTCEQFDALI